MGKSSDKKTKKIKDEAVEWDLSGGFGGIPEEVDLTKNIGCAFNSGKKNKKEEE